MIDLDYKIYRPVLHFTHNGENLKYTIPNSIFHNEQAFYYMMGMAIEEKYEELKLYLELNGGEQVLWN